MEKVDFVLSRLIAIEAVLKALIALHPDHDQLIEAIQASATAMSASAMHGQQAPGMTDAVDRAIAGFLSTSARRGS